MDAARFEGEALEAGRFRAAGEVGFEDDESCKCFRAALLIRVSYQLRYTRAAMLAACNNNC